VGKLPASLRDAFLSYVEAAAGSRRGGASLYVRAHSPGVVSFLNERLSRDLPQPTGAELAEPEVVPTEDLSTTEDFVEGGRRTFVLSVRERSGRAREACIRAKGTRCAACGMSFEEVYGERGAGFIEVHHLNPMAEADGERTVDEAVDLVPVCPNCHRMLHRGERLLTPAELAAHIAETRSSRS
jgi:hypothetical protein